MSHRSTRGRSAARTVALALAASLSLTGCGLLDNGGSEPTASPKQP